MAQNKHRKGKNMRFYLIPEGKIFEYVTMTYTEILGNWAYILLFGIFISMIYLKTQSFELPFLIGIIATAAFYFLVPPEIEIYLILIFALASAISFFRVFKS